MLRKHKVLKKAADVQLTVNVMIYRPLVAINVYLRQFFFSQLYMKMRKISFWMIQVPWPPAVVKTWHHTLFLQSLTRTAGVVDHAVTYRFVRPPQDVGSGSLTGRC